MCERPVKVAAVDWNGNSQGCRHCWKFSLRSTAASFTGHSHRFHQRSQLSTFLRFTGRIFHCNMRSVNPTWDGVEYDVQIFVRMLFEAIMDPQLNLRRSPVSFIKTCCFRVYQVIWRSFCRYIFRLVMLIHQTSQMFHLSMRNTVLRYLHLGSAKVTSV